MPASGTDVDVPVSADWGPGAYVAVHVFRTAADAKSRPGRAIGLTWVGVDPAVRTLDVAFDVPDKYPPRALHRDQAAHRAGRVGQLAAVDEGILRLTNFVSPDPSNHFLGRRRLGLDIRDDWGRLIAPPDGAGDGAAPGRRRGQLRAAGHSAADGDAVHPAGAGGCRTGWRRFRSICPTSTGRCG